MAGERLEAYHGLHVADDILNQAVEAPERESNLSSSSLVSGTLNSVQSSFTTEFSEPAKEGIIVEDRSNSSGDQSSEEETMLQKRKPRSSADSASSSSKEPSPDLPVDATISETRSKRSLHQTSAVVVELNAEQNPWSQILPYVDTFRRNKQSKGWQEIVTQIRSVKDKRFLRNFLFCDECMKFLRDVVVYVFCEMGGSVSGSYLEDHEDKPAEGRTLSLKSKELMNTFYSANKVYLRLGINAASMAPGGARMDVFNHLGVIWKKMAKAAKGEPDYAGAYGLRIYY